MNLPSPILPPPLRLVLQYARLRSTVGLEPWIRQSLATLLPFLRIDEARVRLEYQPEASPAYRATAHLVVPGPDVRAEAVDHTPRTAFLKVLAELRARAVERAARRLRAHPAPRLVRAGGVRW
jgi:ribosome-associated translation inhibitor RaiA